MNTRRIVAAVLLGIVIAAAFAYCAKPAVERFARAIHVAEERAR